MSCAPKCECDKCKVSKELELSRVEATDEILCACSCSASTCACR